MDHAGFWNKEQKEVIIRKLYHNIGLYIIDFLRASNHIPPHRTHNFDIIENSVARKKGTLVLLAHYGNWELLGAIFGKNVSDLNVIAKPMRNKAVDKWLAEKRKLTRVTTIYVVQALRKMLEVIKRNGIMAILIDQHAGNQGTIVPFLGKDANTVRTVAGIVYKTGCSVTPTYAIIGDDGVYDIFITESMAIDTNGKSDDECIYEYQCLHNEIISNWIKEKPEHWFGWFHKRFKETVNYK
jgi:KDO2-lipid IV(A) lauroyltransferase